MGGVQDAGPVNGADNNGVTGSQQYKSGSFLCVVDVFDWFDPAATAAMSVGRRDINSEWRNFQSGNLPP